MASLRALLAYSATAVALSMLVVLGPGSLVARCWLVVVTLIVQACFLLTAWRREALRAAMHRTEMLFRGTF